MQMTYIEENILQAVHNLPIEKQQEILDFSLFLKSNIEDDNLQIKTQRSNFSNALHSFLNDVKENPIEIDTQLFENNRAQASGRDFIL